VIIEGCDITQNGNSLSNSSAIIVSLVPQKMRDFLKLFMSPVITLKLEINKTHIEDNFSHNYGIYCNLRHFVNKIGKKPANFLGTVGK
jgi:hypothetical protein